MAYPREINGRWYACWRDPKGKQKTAPCGEGARGKKLAEQKCRQVEGQLLLGTYDDKKSRPWGTLNADGEITLPDPEKEPATFLDEYIIKCLMPNRASSLNIALASLARFTELVKPRAVNSIEDADVDEFIRLRRQQRGKQEGTKVSHATINKDLRSIRAALRRAKRWKYLDHDVEVIFLREDSKEITFISDEQFVLLHQHAEASNLEEIRDLPNGVTGAMVMRALMTFLYMTGWRINQTLDVDLLADVNLGTRDVFAPADQTKGRRDVLCKLHPIAIEELRPLVERFCKRFVPDSVTIDCLYKQFRRIQRAANVLPARGKEYFGFHDLRRGFATANAENLDLFELQKLMQHKSLETTKKYVNMARRTDSTEKLRAPDVKRPKQA